MDLALNLEHQHKPQLTPGGCYTGENCKRDDHLGMIRRFQYFLSFLFFLSSAPVSQISLSLHLFASPSLPAFNKNWLIFRDLHKIVRASCFSFLPTSGYDPTPLYIASYSFLTFSLAHTSTFFPCLFFFVCKQQRISVLLFFLPLDKAQ